MAAVVRVEALFAALDRLTPDELAFVGLRPSGDETPDDLLDAVDDAARRTGRVALVDEARRHAVDAVLQRYADGTYHATVVGLNWGLSQGTVEDRVAIAEAIANAAAAAVVADVLDPADADALALDAGRLAGLAAGNASEGSLGRALRLPDDPDLGPSRAARTVRALVTGVATADAVLLVGMDARFFGPAIAAGIVAAVFVVRRGYRPSGKTAS